MPPCAQRPADLDHFLRAGGARRRVGQPGGHADGAGLQRLFHPRAHDGDLGRRSLAFQVRHRGHAQRDVAQQHGAVGRRRLLAQGLQIIAVAFVAEPAAVAVQQVQRRHHARRARRQRDAAVAGDHGGDALADLRRHGAVGQHGAVVMGMGVDEARRQHQAARVDLGAPARAGQVAHADDAAVIDGHVALETRRARAVDDLGAPDQQVMDGGHAVSLIVIIRGSSLIVAIRGRVAPLGAARIRLRRSAAAPWGRAALRGPHFPIFQNKVTGASSTPDSFLL